MSSIKIRYLNPLTSGRHPMQVFTLLLCMLAGTPLLLGHPISHGLDSLLPHWISTIWGAMLSIGSLVALIGCYWKGAPITALTLERIGLAFVGYAALVYSFIILVYFGIGGILSAVLIVSFSVASLRRAYDIAKIIRITLAMKGAE